MTETFNLLGIAGSLRGDSYNRRLLERAQRVVPEGVVLRLFDLREVPFYDGDVEAAGDPEGVRALKVAIRDADALLIATPEYNGTIPGVLQNAIDWASRPRGTAPLSEKPVAIAGASPGRGGTARAQAILRQVLANAGAEVIQTRPLLVSAAADALDGDGLALTDDLTALLNEIVERVGQATEQRREQRAA
jgi:chromate reductase